MSSYVRLADWYDRLTNDIPYKSFADFYEAEFDRHGGQFRLILDLCCGTGTLAAIMAGRGYELICTDASVEMLMQAREKTSSCSPAPLLLCQTAEELDLYGTVDAAYSSLDSINYIDGKLIPEVFRRLHLFIRPSGLFLFDLRSEEMFRSIDGSISIDEDDDVLCIWRNDLDASGRVMTYSMDLFERHGANWKRYCEEHTEYVHSYEFIFECLEKAGFSDIQCVSDGPQGDKGRLFFSAVRS